MYAVIQTGGKQYRVQEGDVLRVAKLNIETGRNVSFDDVLLLGEGDATRVGADVVASSVAAEVLEHGRGKKVEIFKKRRRKNSQRTQGHRQAYTSVRITRVGAARVTPLENPGVNPDEVDPAADNLAIANTTNANAINELSAGEETAIAAKKSVAGSEDKE